MMKYVLPVLVLLVLSGTLKSQTIDLSVLLQKISEVPDQNGKKFDPDKVEDEFTFIFIEGTNTVTVDVYSKLSGKRPKENVLIIGGWKDVIPGREYDFKYDHLKGIFEKVSYPILMDINSELFELMELERYSVITISKESNEVEIRSFGQDRAAFLMELIKHLEEVSN